MSEDDIIRMALQSNIRSHIIEFYRAELRHFAEMVAAAEREECAQVAERMLRYYTQAVTGVPEAIRARGEK